MNTNQKAAASTNLEPCFHVNDNPDALVDAHERRVQQQLADLKAIATEHSWALPAVTDRVQRLIHSAASARENRIAAFAESNQPSPDVDVEIAQMRAESAALTVAEHFALIRNAQSGDAPAADAIFAQHRRLLREARDARQLHVELLWSAYESDVVPEKTRPASLAVLSELVAHWQREVEIWARITSYADESAAEHAGMVQQMQRFGARPVDRQDFEDSRSIHARSTNARIGLARAQDYYQAALFQLSV